MSDLCTVPVKFTAHEQDGHCIQGFRVQQMNYGGSAVKAALIPDCERFGDEEVGPTEKKSVPPITLR